MSKGRFTPGPWKAHIGTFRAIEAADGQILIASTHKEHPDYGIGIARSEAEDNAYVIAAVPELLEACLAVVQANDYDAIEAAKALAEDAIEKAQLDRAPWFHDGSQKKSLELARTRNAVIDSARAYLEHGFTSDRRKLRDALRDYDDRRAVSTETDP